jgi:hypothetical protein
MFTELTEVAFSLLRDTYGLKAEQIDSLDPALLVQRVQGICGRLP